MPKKIKQIKKPSPKKVAKEIPHQQVQQVIIRLDSEGKRKKIKRRARVPKKESEMLFDERYYRQFPAPTIYQSSTYVPIPQSTINPPVNTPQINPVPVVQPFLEDIGQVGTEGRVEILDRPTKREQLEDFITPVSLEKYNEQMLDTFNKNRKFFESLAPPKPKPFISEEAGGEIKAGGEMQAEAKKRRTKKEMSEARSMEREDIASINLGLNQFNPPFKTKPIDEENASVMSGITQSEQPTEIISNVTTSFKKNTWGDLLQRYRKIEGTNYQRRKGYSKNDFQTLVEQMEQTM